MLMPIKLNYFVLIKIYDKIDLDLKLVFFIIIFIMPHILALAPITKLKQNLKLTLRFQFFLNFMIFCSLEIKILKRKHIPTLDVAKMHNLTEPRLQRLQDT